MHPDEHRRNWLDAARHREFQPFEVVEPQPDHIELSEFGGGSSGEIHHLTFDEQRQVIHVDGTPVTFRGIRVAETGAWTLRGELPDATMIAISGSGDLTPTAIATRRDLEIDGLTGTRAS